MTENQSGKITEEERAQAIAFLEHTRDKLLAVTNGISPAQSHFKLAEDRWSLLQYTEHLATSEAGLLALVRKTLSTPPQPDMLAARAEREQHIAKLARETPRGANQAPARLQPQGKYATVAEAMADFLKNREKTIAYARETQDDLRLHFAPHGVFGPLDAFQWLMANGNHVNSHSKHMEELKAHPDYPRA